MAASTDTTLSFSPSTDSLLDRDNDSPLESPPIPQDLVKHLRELSASSSLPFQKFCLEVFEFTAEEIPELRAMIEAFKANPGNQPYLQKWKDASWNDLKAACKRGEITEEQMTEWHSFRLRAKNEIEKMIDLVLQHYDYAPIRWQMVGTPGWSSDIDNSALSDDPEGEISVTLGKLLFDVFWFQSFGDLSGTQADLETYTSHAGERETYLQLKTEKGQQQYSAVAFLGSHIALRRAMSKGEWDLYRKEFLQTHHELFGDSVVLVYAHLMDQVERFYESSEKQLLREVFVPLRMKLYANLPPASARMQAETDFDTLSLEEIQKMMEEVDISERDLKIARYNIKMGQLFNIGCQITKCDQELLSLEAQLLTHQDEETRQHVYRRMDALHITIARLSILRESLQDEGYITQGAYLNVCKHTGSQSDQRAREKISRQMSMYGNAMLKIPKHRDSMTHELVESVLENGAGYFHKMHQYAHDPLAALTESAKYTKRVTDAAQNLLPRRRKLSRAQIFLISEKRNPGALLLSLKRKTVATNVIEQLFAVALQKQNDSVQALYDFMESQKTKAPQVHVKRFFYQSLYAFFAQGEKPDPSAMASFKAFLKDEFGQVEDNWDALTAKMKHLFPMCVDIETTAETIDSRMQKLQKKMGPEYTVVSSTDRYRFALQSLGMKKPIVVLDPIRYEPLNPFMGSIIAATTSYQHYGFQESAQEMLSVQKGIILRSLGLEVPEELQQFSEEMNTSMRRFLIEMHAHALSEFRYPVAVELSLQD